MPANSIHDFSSKFRGGVRANLFNCRVTPPNRSGVEEMFQFHCKGTSMPASTIGNIDVPYKGRQLKVPGDRTFADWTVTVFNDNGMRIRGIFENWMASIQHHDVNEGVMHPYGRAQVHQKDRAGDVMRTYTVDMIYPTEVAAIDVAWDSNDAVEEYAVTFAVNDYHYGEGHETAGSGSSFKGSVSLDSDGNLGINAEGLFNLLK